MSLVNYSHLTQLHSEQGVNIFLSNLVKVIMRLKLSCQFVSSSTVLFNYSYQLQNVIYSFIRNSSPEFSAFLHNTGFVEENRPFKLFTFSKLFFEDGYLGDEGFTNVSSFHLMFSTPIQKNYEHLVLGIFANQNFTIHFSKKHSVKALISSVESLAEPSFDPEMRFVCLSPIAVSTGKKIGDRVVQHYLDYMIPEERKQFVKNLRNNLLKKYKLIHKKDFEGNPDFDLSFDVDYIMKRKGSIRKNIKFKRDKESGRYTHIIGMEAPFTVKADPELINIGYQCGFGEKNSAGFGMVEKIK